MMSYFCCLRIVFKSINNVVAPPLAYLSNRHDRHSCTYLPPVEPQLVAMELKVRPTQ